MSTHVPLPAGTTLGKSFEYGLDLNLGSYGDPVWQPVRRMSGFNPTFPAITSDVGTYDDRGGTNEDVDSRGFATSFTVLGNRSLATGLYLPELERIVAASRDSRDGAVIDGRFYHKPDVGVANPNDAGRFLARVDANRENTGNTGAERWAVTLTGKGAYEKIANPFTGWGSTAPTVSFVSPEGALDGELITISGSGFLDATAVTVDGAPVSEFIIINASSLVAVLPVGDAGAVPVVVTTPGGSAAPYTFVRGA
ncbi:hypothetical protein HF576_01880 [Microbacterium sp. CFH 90308]|uniref:IPT/TIG domain-containing protein n=1 Tax=Microbacterium salsuginis TaxID=2722803 RepID=A0ABX1K6F1_9MICO|nr:IPT/TIG domain-containing protein [Microbacterium sp. CFH 90308]NLP82588.1 hypothetical protein [Microbacterium sp. CFH 90308]